MAVEADRTEVRGIIRAAIGHRDDVVDLDGIIAAELAVVAATRQHTLADTSPGPRGASPPVLLAARLRRQAPARETGLLDQIHPTMVSPSGWSPHRRGPCRARSRHRCSGLPLAMAERDASHAPTAWRERFAAEGLKASSVVRPGRGRKPSIPEKVEGIVRATLHETPEGETHWSCRSMAKAHGVSPAKPQPLWRSACEPVRRHQQRPRALHIAIGRNLGAVQLLQDRALLVGDRQWGGGRAHGSPYRNHHLFTRHATSSAPLG